MPRLFFIFKITKIVNFDLEIFNVLLAAGAKGLKMEKIARHVFNSCNSLFTPLNYKEVHAYVTQYLTKCAKNPQSAIEKGKGYGVYRLKYGSSEVSQLMLKFSETVAENEDKGGREGNVYVQKPLFEDNFFDEN